MSHLKSLAAFKSCDQYSLLI